MIMKIVKLTRKKAKDNLKMLIDIDRKALGKYGNMFSSEKWDAHFLKDIKGKWQYSYVAMDKSKIIGYCISSLLDRNTLYIHRIAVKPLYQKKMIGTSLIRQIANKKPIVVLEVNIKNNHAIAFYEKLKFKRMTGEGFEDYLIQRDKMKKSRVYKDCFIEDGYPDKKIVLEYNCG